MKNLYSLTYILILCFAFTSCEVLRTVPSQENPNQALTKKYAQILNVEDSTLTNTKLYAFIDNWYGTKYKYGGLTKKGIDCSGFANVLYNEVYQKILPRSSYDIVNVIDVVEKEQLKEGDLVFFNIGKNKNSHVGIYLVNHYFVHASTSSGVIISSLDNPYYVKAYSKGGSVK